MSTIKTEVTQASRATPKTVSAMVNAALDVNLTVITDVNGNCWFVAKQIADALGYVNNSMAYEHCKHLNADPTVSREFNRISNLPPATKWCSEGDMVRMMMFSQKETAVEFQDWVCDEVLPNLRKSESVITNQPPALSNKQVAFLESDIPTLQVRLEKLEADYADLKFICDGLRQSLMLSGIIPFAKSKGIDINTLNLPAMTARCHALSAEMGTVVFDEDNLYLGAVTTFDHKVLVKVFNEFRKKLKFAKSSKAEWNFIDK